MSDNTGIEWTDATWNPTTGCDKVSPGCDHCYAMTLAPRLKAMGSAHYQTDGDPRTSGPGFGVVSHFDALDKPLRWKKPRRIFVNSMSDLFHEQVPDHFIATVFAVMACAPQHTFQLLTKRHGRMRSLLSSDEFVSTLDLALGGKGDATWVADGPGWPLPNVWLGVSVENQQWFDIRWPALRDTPAAVRFLSMEPLLGPVDLINGMGDSWLTDLDWVIVGGESGRGARPLHPEWAREIRDHCDVGGVPFLFKQWGEYVTPEQAPETFDQDYFDGPGFYRVGKKRAGRELDGRTWDEFPKAVV
jgi:protein gp37